MGIDNGSTTPAPERSQGLRIGRPASQLHQGGGRAQRHAGRDQPPGQGARGSCSRTPLFHRLTRALRLTDAGQAALPTLGQGFDKLAQAVERMRAHCESDVLTISVSPSFGAMWLAPRIERFRSRYPDIEIRIDGTDRRVDLARGDADVALRYGPGGYDGVRVDRLFGQVNTPVCSPALLQRRAPLAPARRSAPSHPAAHRLERRRGELAYVAAGGRLARHRPDPRPALHPWRAWRCRPRSTARAWRWSATCWSADDLAAGRLVRPFDPSLSTPLTFSYYLLSAKDNAGQPKVAAFRDWLLEEARASRPQSLADHEDHGHS